MAIVPYTSTNQAGSTIFFQRHSQSGEGDDAADAVTGVVGIVDSSGNEIGSSNPLPISLPLTRVFVSDLTLDNSGAYASGDTLADILEVTNAVGTTAGTATIQEITLIDTDDQGQPLDLIFYDSTVTLSAKNAAWSISTTDAKNSLGHISIDSADYKTFGSHKQATVPGTIGIQPASGTSIYLGVISRGTPTHTVNGLTIKISILRDS